MTAPAPSRNQYIDVLRGGSIFGVICVHFAGSFVTTDAHAWSPSFHLGLALNQCFSFAVPLFVFLSGLLAGASRKTPSLGEYYRGRLARIGGPYLLASLASFFLLNHYAAWQALPGLHAKFTWLWRHLCFYGVEPTLYFIPLILQLYLLQPLLKALPGWVSGPLRLPPAAAALLLAALFLALHLFLGLRSYQGALDYYVWARPNGLFWLFYFFLGLHFPLLTAALSPRAAGWGALVAFLGAAGAMAWNYGRLLDRSLMGASFQFNRLDFAYARPEMMAYDLAAVLALAAGIKLAWSPRGGWLALLGRYSLEIYLWHILVLYYGAWQFPATLAACREVPELMVCIALGAALLIAGVFAGYERLRDFARGHRLAILPRA